MSGGDFLFIFSFIVLPTAILVSAIWALIALRAGVLLPPRRVVEHEYDAWDEGRADEPAAERLAAERTVPVAVSRDGIASDGASEAVTEVITAEQATPVSTVEQPSDVQPAGEALAEQTLEMDALEEPPVSESSVASTDDADVAPVEENVRDEGILAADANDDSTSQSPDSGGDQKSSESSTLVPDDLDIVFVPTNRGELASGAVSSSALPELPDGTEPMAVERPDAEVESIQHDDDDQEYAAVTPVEATIVDDDLPRARKNGTHRRGSRMAARQRVAEEPERRQRLLVSSPARRGLRSRREAEGGSVGQDESAMER